MSNHRSNDAKLESLEKWRCSELDLAQVLHSQKQAVAKENEQSVKSVQGTIDESQDLARAQMETNTIISVESLTRLRHYTAQQLGELKQAQQVLDDSRREVEVAQAEIIKRFEERTVVERLRKRRTTQAEKETLRKEQRNLDDQALLRLSEREFE